MGIVDDLRAARDGLMEHVNRLNDRIREHEEMNGPTMVYILLDASGSMAGLAGDVRGAINTYLDTLALSEEKFVVTIMAFDSLGSTIIADHVEPGEAPRLDERNYRAGASTPLLDAMGKMITLASDKVAYRGTNRVLFTVYTDGYENASTEWTKERVVKLIKEKEEKGWAFAYLGVAPDAWGQEQLFAGTQMVNNVRYSSGGKGFRASTQYMAGQTIGYAGTGNLTVDNDPDVQ